MFASYRSTCIFTLWNARVKHKLDPEYARFLGNLFGEDHIATKLAEMGPWFILKDIPLDVIDLPKCVMETTRAQIVKDWREQLIYMLSDQRGIEKPILTNTF